MNRWLRTLFATLMLLDLLVTPAITWARDALLHEVILFNGENTSAAVDTVEQASPWFEVKGASRVDIRIWSGNTSAWTAADSIYSDSLTTFKVLLSDSICCTVNGRPSMGDSVMFDMAIAAQNPDTAGFGIVALRLPINKAIAPAKTGSGRVTSIFPDPSLPDLPAAADAQAVFIKKWMRIRWQPLRRNTEGGRLSTEGKRTAGIRGLKMRGYTYYPNK